MPTTDMTTVDDTVRQFIHAVRTLEQTFIGTTPPQEIKDAFAEGIQAAQLFDPAMINPMPIYRELRLQLGRYGVVFGPVDSHLPMPLRTPMLLATTMYPEGADREEAKTVATALAEASRLQRSRQTTGTTIGASSHATSGSSYNSEKAMATRHAQYVASRFAHKQFTGDYRQGQVWSESVSDFQSVARDFDLNADMRYKLLHNILGGDAKRYCPKNVQGHAASYNEAVAKMEAEYNSHSRQMQVKNYISSFRMHNLIVNLGTTEPNALAKTYSLIHKLAPMTPPSYRTDSAKVDFSRPPSFATRGRRKPSAARTTAG
ncbi:hypothetical protein I4F81_001368 [Pyropia yezoensis]|uniref:Uncharacterized protein n=1 Tax=Pyropia yezoensis TaxID=2788 RepID=A0ACC3BLH8_PYRYE|nr:hypothetical protein I4F81_001368 [Neopyropia yezoensis]